MRARNYFEKLVAIISPKIAIVSALLIIIAYDGAAKETHHFFKAELLLGPVVGYGDQAELTVTVVLTNVGTSTEVYARLNDLRDHFTVRNHEGSIVFPSYRGGEDITGFVDTLEPGETKTLPSRFLRMYSLPKGMYTIEAELPIRNATDLNKLLDTIHADPVTLAIP